MTLEQFPASRVDDEHLEPQVIDFMEIGVLDNLPFSGGFGRSANELIDPSTVTVQELRDMYRKDGQVRSIYRLLALPIRTLAPQFMPREGESSDGEEEAQFVTDAFTKPPAQGGMTTSFGRTLTQMTKALADGFACFEKVWHVVDGQVVYRKFAPRASDTVTFILDETGGLEAVRQRVHWQGRFHDVVIPSEKLLIYTAQHEENPFYGESYLLPAYYDYDNKTKLKYISNLAHQFHAVPGRIGSYPAGAQRNEKNAFRKALASFGFNTAMAKPADFLVEEFGGKGTMPDFKGMLDYFDTQMAKSVLVQFQQLGTGSSTGSYSLSSDQSDLFTMALQAVADEMAEVIAFYAVPQLVSYNFDSHAFPDVTLGPLADATKEMMAEVFKEVVDAANTNVTGEFLFELEAKVAGELGLEIDYEKLREEMQARIAEERELAMAAQRALMEGMAAPQDDSGDSGAPGDEESQQGPSVAASEVISMMDAMRMRRSRRRG